MRTSELGSWVLEEKSNIARPQGHSGLGNNFPSSPKKKTKLLNKELKIDIQFFLSLFPWLLWFYTYVMENLEIEKVI